MKIIFTLIYFMKFFFNYLTLALFFTGGFFPLCAQLNATDREQWVEQMYRSMSTEEKIGQLFMAEAYSDKKNQNPEKILKLIQQEHIGGLIFMQNDALEQARLNNIYQKNSKVPLLISTDAEWDLGMRLKNGYRFPWALSLGALSDESLVYRLGQKIAQHCRRMGIHINFAPVLDINTNSANPIIGKRSFGSDPENVARKSIAYAQGIEKEGVMAVAKHFPGHGDTSVDSHKSLPVLKHTYQRLEAVELYPFRRYIQAGGRALMSGHLLVPALGDKKEPASLSKTILENELKGRMNFNGLIFSDALNMKAVAHLYPAGMLELKAFQAGNDLLLFSQNIQAAKIQFFKALEKGLLSMERIEKSVKKILAAKYEARLFSYTPVSEQHLLEDLNDPQSEALHREIMEKAITLLKNDGKILPIRSLNSYKFAYVALGEGSNETYYDYLRRYAQVEKISVKSLSDLSKLNAYELVFVGIHKSDDTPWKSSKISASEQTLLQAISRIRPTLLSIFTSPYALSDIDIKNFPAILMAYQNSEQAQSIVPQIIFGALGAYGKLPVEISPIFKAGQGLEYSPIERLSYGMPESVGMDSLKLNEIDDIVYKAIGKGATPGAQVVVARNAKVIYQRSFGKLDYKNNKKALWDHLYDLASLTKILTTVPLLMQLKEKIPDLLYLPLKNFLPAAENTDKGDLNIKELLTHQAGLPSWIPFYKYTLDSAFNYLPQIYSAKKDTTHPVQVAQNLYIKKNHESDIYQLILESPLRNRGTYKYSDLGFYFLKDFIEKQNARSIASLADAKLYQPLGAYSMGYCPLRRFPPEKIAPTEEDKFFRKQLLRGYVHDQGAALLGGIAGHSGLFANANDVAKIMQLYLQNGYYGGQRYFQEATVKQFTAYQFKDSKRALGFDKPSIKRTLKYPFSFSEKSYGHTGFTGTMAWADPEDSIVYVFLSNRVHPDAENNLLQKMRVREQIQEVVHAAIVQ